MVCIRGLPSHLEKRRQAGTLYFRSWRRLPDVGRDCDAAQTSGWKLCMAAI